MKKYHLTAQQLRAIEYAMTLAEYFAHGELPASESDAEQAAEDMDTYNVAKEALKQIRTQENNECKM